MKKWIAILVLLGVGTLGFLFAQSDLYIFLPSVQITGTNDNTPIPPPERVNPEKLFPGDEDSDSPLLPIPIEDFAIHPRPFEGMPLSETVKEIQ